jgi:flagellar basal-body rod modification protein FlgD
MTTINSIDPRNAPVVPNGAATKSLGQTDFLRLLTTQLKEQDPFNPTDNTQMVAQMAQFSSVTGISEMNVSLKAIAEQIADQTKLLGEIKAASQLPASNPVS